MQAAASTKCDQPIRHTMSKLTPYVSRRIFKAFEQMFESSPELGF